MKKIIVADDNKTFLMYLALLLKKFDLKVMPAENGLEVLRLLKLAKTDLVILDVHMKVMDGFAALRHIKGDKRTRHIPVIMMSYDSDVEMADRCRQLECFDYLTKPLKIDSLHDSIQRCLFAQKGTSRRYLRVSFNSKIVLTHEGIDYRLCTETLSEGGMYVIKEEPLPVGSEVAVKCDLGERGEIRAKGNVIYATKLFGDYMALPPGMAIRFHELDKDDAIAIKFCIEDHMTKAIVDNKNDGYFER